MTAPSHFTPVRPRFIAGIATALGLFLGAQTGIAQAFVWPNVSEQVARALATGDVSERRTAAQRLSELPPRIALPLVAQAMEDPDVEVRLRGAQAAIALHLPKGGDRVIAWLRDSDPRIRLAGCEVIRAEPTDRSVVALGRVLGDPDPHVRLAAAAAMGSSGMAEAVSPLLGHLDDASPDVREEVARALGRLGDTRAVVPLMGKVQDSIPEVRKVVAHALGALGDARAAGALMLTLQDASADVRVEAVTALGHLRSDEATLAIAPLVQSGGIGSTSGLRATQGSGTGSNEVSTAAFRALGLIGSDAAVKILIGALAQDDVDALHSPVRDALTLVGARAEAPLIATIASAVSPNTAAGAALVLGALRAHRAVEGISHAMQRGIVPTHHGLRALAALGAPEALPTVLEMLDASDAASRLDAIVAAEALLDPARVDGRPIEPARVALGAPGTPLEEKVALLRLLGRTGATRAETVIAPFLSARPAVLRVAAIEALGNLHGTSPAVDEALLRSLDDDAPDVRVHAATALAKVARPATARVLLQRLIVAAEQDRGSLGMALSGTLARVTDPAAVALVRESFPGASESARDALIEGLGRMPGEPAATALASLGVGSIDDRRKVAEALGGHPEAEEALRRFAADADGSVRANAAWSLGVVGRKESLPVLLHLVDDPDVAAAGNAVAAMGRIADRLGDASAVQPALCAALADARPYVRANALEALALANASCAGALELLTRDPSEEVRLAAAAFASKHLEGGKDHAGDASRQALARCAGEDHDALVARRCAHASLESTAAPASKPLTDDVAIYVVPDGTAFPQARAPFALVRADGLLRLGLADRRGAIFELGAPRGTMRLAVPAALAR